VRPRLAPAGRAPRALLSEDDPVAVAKAIDALV